MNLNVDLHPVSGDICHDRKKYLSDVLNIVRKVKPMIGISYSYDGYHFAHVAQYISRVNERIGFADKGLGFMLTSSVFRPQQARYIDEIATLFSTVFDDPVLTNADEIYNRWLVYIKGLKFKYILPSGRKCLCISMTPMHRFRWSSGKWLSLLQTILRQFDVDLIFLDSGQDERTANTIRELSRQFSADRVYDFTGKTGLLDVFSLFRADGVLGLITHDSGLRHLANLAGLRQVVLRPEHDNSYRWGKYRETEILLSAPQPCSPCGLAKCKYSNIPCMEEITVEKCFKAVAEILN
ncbi:MAG: glycosyltransferase family 9 protein [Kiritimatiellae bacterium]|nr:glycosyltransferase family 9 protein [Kiritimatiellia bacterium]MDD5523064.1 glycosyltransferase family 9 protein [Kiritimatiellia bacterium]